MPQLRDELLMFTDDDGNVEVLDLLLERTHHFDAEEAAALDALPEGELPPALAAKLQAALLLEGPSTAVIREAARHGRTRPMMPPPTLEPAEGPWELAETLPACVAPAWREPERWRRLAEDRVAQRVILRAEGFLRPEHARRLRGDVDGLEFAAHHSFYATGEGAEVEGELDTWAQHFRSGPLHALLSAVMGLELPERIFLRAWRFGPGDKMAAHKDGLHYVTTFSIGLCEGWTAGHGGAIAFGDPLQEGMRLQERWIPHLGDLLLFRPTATAWHAVEPVVKGTRHTLTGHFVADSYPG